LSLSAPQAVFTVGVAGSFTVSASGNPTLRAGILPPGLQFTDHGGGTSVITGTPAATAAAGSYPLTLTATNAVGSSTQPFTLTVS
jgi:hypothetical protein